MSIKKIVITAGGTGGHLYPAQALAQQLGKEASPPDVLFVAGGLSNNRHFDKKLFLYEEISCSPLFSLNPIKSFKGLLNLFKGFRESLAILKKNKPDIVIGFGSFYTVHMLLAAKWLKIPIILHEANSVPGRANQWLSSFATVVALHFPSTAAFFKGRTVEVGLPLREGYSLAAISKEEALSYYGFSPERQTLLIFGGSQGARAINQLLPSCMPFLQKLPLQIIHLTGDLKMAEQLAAIYALHSIPAIVKPFESQMQKAWRAADCFLGRSGASTIAEAIEFEVPGILIPYPYATDNHQEKNADFLIEIVGSACKLLEPGLTPAKLEGAIKLFFDPDQILTFKKALKVYKQRPHQITLCQLVLNPSSVIAFGNQIS